MIYIYSGLDQNSFAEWWDDSDTCMPALMAPVEFFSEMQQRPTSSEKCAWVWLYKAPWELSGVSSHAEQSVVLREWHLRQQSVLNIVPDSSSELLIVDAQITTYSSFQHTRTSPKKSYIKNSKLCNSKAHIIAMFKKLAPRYWDTFEALQSVSYLSRNIVMNNELKFSEDYFIRLLVSCKNEEGLSVLLGESRKTRLALAQMESDLILERKLKFQLETQIQTINDTAVADQTKLQSELAFLQAQLDYAQTELMDCHAMLSEYSKLLNSSQRTLQRAEIAIRDNIS